MVRQTVPLDILEDGQPLLLHQNALAYVFGNSKRKTFPSHVVYPDRRTAIGLQPSQFHSFFSDSSRETVENEDEASEQQEGKLLVYASESSKEAIRPRLFKPLFILLLCTMLQFGVLLTSFILAWKSHLVIGTVLSQNVAFMVLLVNDIILLYFCLWWRQALIIKLLAVVAKILACVCLFSSVRNSLNLLFLLFSPVKFYCFGKVIFLTIPHVFAVSGNS